MSELISGKEALIALADGQEVQIKSNEKWLPVENCQVYQFLYKNCDYKFRLKPKTITINGIEVPCCGDGYQYGDVMYILNSLEPKEYNWIILDKADEIPVYWWRTEKEIKQVVAALRKVFKGGVEQ